MDLKTAQESVEKFFKKSNNRWKKKIVSLVTKNNHGTVTANIPNEIHYITKIIVSGTTIGSYNVIDLLKVVICNVSCEVPEKIQIPEFLYTFDPRSNHERNDIITTEFSVSFSGQPFPVFMFPDIRHSLMVSNMKDVEIKLELLFHRPERIHEKKILLQSMYNQPWLYRSITDVKTIKLDRHFISETKSIDDLFKNIDFDTKPTPDQIEEVNKLGYDVPTESDFGESQQAVLDACRDYFNSLKTGKPLESDHDKNLRKNLATMNKFACGPTSISIPHYKNIRVNTSSESLNIFPDDSDLPHKSLDLQINGLGDILSLIDKTESDIGLHKFSINIRRLHNAKTQIDELNSMIGLTESKNMIAKWLMYFLSDVPNKSGFMNLVLCGTSGIGKTTFATKLADVFSKIGATKKDKITKIKASEFIAQYMGQTEEKTTSLLENGKDGVIFIDEAYSITRGSTDEKNSYGTRALDILNQFVGENPDTIVILGGYKNDIQKYVFDINEGLKRRFPWSIDMKDYDSTELLEILKYHIDENGYSQDLDKKTSLEISKIFTKNREYLKYNGGDMINIITKTIANHCSKILSIDPKNKLVLSKNEILDSINEYIETEKDPKTNSNSPPPSMYQ